MFAPTIAGLFILSPLIDKRNFVLNSRLADELVVITTARKHNEEVNQNFLTLRES